MRGAGRRRYENLEGDQSKKFYLQYSFPPFSVGEVGRIGAPGRREVGHRGARDRFQLEEPPAPLDDAASRVAEVRADQPLEGRRRVAHRRHHREY